MTINRMLTGVAARRELRAVFDALFSLGGSDVVSCGIADYDLAQYRNAFGGHAGSRDYSCADLLPAANAHRDIAIGVYRPAGQKCNRRYPKSIQL